nr:cytochrome P450 89A2-like [Tanacetum cinerariifolium]
MRNISTSSYGPTWRLLRRNLASEIMHPYRIKSYSWARKWVLCNLIDKLHEQRHEAVGIKMVDHFQYAMFSLLVLMCFGEKFDEGRINEIAKAQRDMLLVSGRFRVLAMYPRLGKILFRNRWKEFEKLSGDKERLLIPIIKSRVESDTSDKEIVAYVDTLVNLQLPEDEGNNGNGEKLTGKEMVSMCSEFLNAGTDTTTNALQWIMANILKHPHIQRSSHTHGAQRDMLLVSGRFRVLAMYPRLGKILFRNRWKEFEKLSGDKERLLIPIIKSRVESDNSDKEIVAYVDTLVNLQLPEDEGNNGNGEKLTDKEMTGRLSWDVPLGRRGSLGASLNALK